MTIQWAELRVGSRNADTGNWQRFLREQGYRGYDGYELKIDEDFGQRTAFATKTWQRTNGRVETGVVAALDRRAATAQGFIGFLQARNYTPVPAAKPRTVSIITIHDMEYPETPSGAEWCAEFFAGPNAPRASAHYCIDGDSVLQCVRDRDVAWHAPGANHNGIGIEHAGYAKQSRADWLDDYSRAELAISARLVAKLSALYGIPLVRLSPAELRAGKYGLAGHADITAAFPGPGRTHWDPGLSFPWDVFLKLCQDALKALP